MSAEETTKNFWAVWNSFVWPEIRTAEPRLYYSDDGSPINYTMEDLPGQYITITSLEFMARRWDVKVIDGQLHPNIAPIRSDRLVKDPASGTPCHPQDITLIVSDDQFCQRWRLPK